MTEKEERKYVHLIARFEGTMHCHIRILSCEMENYNKRKVIATIKTFKYGFMIEDDRITESWRVVT